MSESGSIDSSRVSREYTQHDTGENKDGLHDVTDNVGGAEHPNDRLNHIEVVAGGNQDTTLAKVASGLKTGSAWMGMGLKGLGKGVGGLAMGVTTSAEGFAAFAGAGVAGATSRLFGQTREKQLEHAATGGKTAGLLTAFTVSTVLLPVTVASRVLQGLGNLQMKQKEEVIPEAFKKFDATIKTHMFAVFTQVRKDRDSAGTRIGDKFYEGLNKLAENAKQKPETEVKQPKMRGKITKPVTQSSGAKRRGLPRDHNKGEVIDKFQRMFPDKPLDTEPDFSIDENDLDSKKREFELLSPEARKDLEKDDSFSFKEQENVFIPFLPTSSQPTQQPQTPSSNSSGRALPKTPTPQSNQPPKSTTTTNPSTEVKKEDI